MDRLSFQQLFSALPSPHMILDRDLNYTAVNAAYEKVTSRTEEELLGRNLFDMFPNDGPSGEKLRRSLERVFETGKPDTIAYLEYPIPVPESLGGGFQSRFWTTVHSPLTDPEGQVRFVLQNTVDISELVQLRQALTFPTPLFPGEVELVQRAREAETAYQETRERTGEFHRLFEESPGMVALLHGPEHIFTFANEAYRSFVGHRDLLGMPVRTAVPELQAQSILEMLNRVYRTGKAEIGYGTRILLRDRTTGEPREAYFDFSYHPILNRNEEITGLFIQSYDRTQTVQALERQRLLIDELNHRVKNTLSTVQSLARRSFKAAQDPEEARTVFELRILALSNAHNLLSAHHWEGADLEAVLRQESSLAEGERISMDGPFVRVSARAAIAFAMVFHELVTNAIKYGALASSHGQLDIRWKREGDRLQLRWQETGIPESLATLEQGFGLRMLERIVVGELDGHLDLAVAGTSLSYTIDVLMTEIGDFASSRTS